MTQSHGQQIPLDPGGPHRGRHPPRAERRPRAWREYGTLVMAIVGLTLSLSTFLAAALR
ncbi:hypothetical protein ACFVTY_07640 [Streptomyces sp. NPDC058067]|uniref:hypothetical protein n=1 Tax=Streptomyces sp. NPDC058067 TaxID=3346324 RepID=UPI0036EF7DEC